tara:strand:- start:1301 stop:2086 length:786 start_codon:yes stop_codon:yes gene_type:complete
MTCTIIKVHGDVHKVKKDEVVSFRTLTDSTIPALIDLIATYGVTDVTTLPTPVVSTEEKLTQLAHQVLMLTEALDVSNLKLEVIEESLSNLEEEVVIIAPSGNNLVVDAAYDQTFGLTLDTPIDLSATADVISATVNLNGFDNYWGCIFSGSKFRMSHEGLYGDEGRLNFEYQSLGGAWWQFGTFVNLPDLTLNVDYVITLQVDVGAGVVRVTVDGVEDTLPVTNGTPENLILEAVGVNTTTQGTINYVIADISDVQVVAN